MDVVAMMLAFASLMQSLLPVAPAAPTTPVVQARPVSTTTLSVTAYCATGNINAAGHYPRVGEAAGNRWPLGTKLSVPGYGTVFIEDRIGYGSDLDLYFGADAGCTVRADAWGRRALPVTVLP